MHMNYNRKMMTEVISSLKAKLISHLLLSVHLHVFREGKYNIDDWTVMAVFTLPHSS